MFQEVGLCMGFSEGGGVSSGLSQPGGKSLAERALMLWCRIPDGRRLEETVGGVDGVLHDAVGSAGALCVENVPDGGKRGTDDLCSCVYCPLEGLAVNFSYS